MALGGGDILRLIIDADSSGATKEFDKLGKNIKSSLGDVEKQASGLKGKLGSAFDGFASKSSTVTGVLDKIGLSGQQAGAAIATAIPAAGVVAAGALVAFAKKGVDAFQETALAAGKFADTTGLSVDTASRYIAVADDIGVGAGTIQSAFLKMEKAIGTNKQAFGDLISTTKSGGTDLSKTFLNAIKHLQGIKDPIDRATEASKLFGKGFGEVSELINTDAGTLEKALDGVSKAQVINEGELKKARDYRAAMDNLHDAVNDLSISLGQQLVSSLASAAEGLSFFVDLVNKLPDSLSSSLLGGGLGNIGSAFKAIFDRGVEGVGEVQGALDGLDLSNIKAGTVDAGGFGAALDTAAAKALDLKNKWDLLRGSLSVKDAQLSLEDSFARVQETAKAAWEATASGAEDAAAKVNDNKQAVNDLEQKIVDYGEKVFGLPPEQVTNILAEVDQGDIAGAKAALDKVAEDRKAAFKAKEDTGATSAVEKAFENTARTRQALMKASADATGAEGELNNTARSRAASISASANTDSADRELNNVARDRTATISVNLQGQKGTLVRFSARGSNYFPGGLSVVGEEGPELVEIPRGSKIHTAAQTRQMVGTPGPPLLSGTGAGGSSSGVNVYLQGTFLGTRREVGRWVDEALAEARRAGNRAA